MSVRFWDTVRSLQSFVLDLLLPPHCLGCGKEGSLLCSTCEQTLHPLSPPFCRCGRPLANPGICPHCLDAPLTIDGIRSAFPFHGLIREAIHQLKYRGISSLAEPLSQLLHQYLQAQPLPADVLVPVPLHGQRLRQRGFNQSLLLAAGLGRRTQLPVWKGALQRIRSTVPQAQTANAAERRANVQGAFASSSRDLAGARILLIDDVCTTGSTLDVCATALREGSAASVWGLTLAREL